MDALAATRCDGVRDPLRRPTDSPALVWAAAISLESAPASLLGFGPCAALSRCRALAAALSSAERGFIGSSSLHCSCARCRLDSPTSSSVGWLEERERAVTERLNGVPAAGARMQRQSPKGWLRRACHQFFHLGCYRWDPYRYCSLWGKFLCAAKKWYGNDDLKLGLLIVREHPTCYTWSSCSPCRRTCTCTWFPS